MSIPRTVDAHEGRVDPHRTGGLQHHERKLLRLVDIDRFPSGRAVQRDRGRLVGSGLQDDEDLDDAGHACHLASDRLDEGRPLELARHRPR